MSATSKNKFQSDNLRVLRHTAGTIEALSQNAAHRFATQHALVHYRSGAIFTFIPKNACTSLRVSLALANGAISSTDDWTWVHSNNGTFSANLPDLARAHLTAVILRCPFRRLASTFLDKIVSRSSEFWSLHRKSHDMIDPDRLTFREFVDWVGKPGYLQSNIHWRPQRDFLVYKRYDRVFAFEEISTFGSFFEEVTGHPFVDARSLSGHATSDFERLNRGEHADTPMAELTWQKSNGRLPRQTDLYDPALIDRVAEIYAGDIQLYSNLIGPRASFLLFPRTEADQ